MFQDHSVMTLSVSLLYFEKVPSQNVRIQEIYNLGVFFLSLLPVPSPGTRCFKALDLKYLRTKSVQGTLNFSSLEQFHSQRKRNICKEQSCGMTWKKIKTKAGPDPMKITWHCLS